MRKKAVQEFHIINVKQKKEEAFIHLAQVIDVFKALEITYWIEYGTLLGAVREKTVIPWDSEFDIGIWNSDFSRARELLLKNFYDLGFIINFTAKDRIKLRHKNSIIGAFTIDIHTYHVKDDIAYVSFNKPQKSLYNYLLNNIYKSFKANDNNNQTIYFLGKLISGFLTISDDIPDEFTLYPGRFNSPNSFLIKGKDNLLYNSDLDFVNKMGLVGKLGVYMVSLIPLKLRNYIFNKLEKRFKNRKISNDIQAIPIFFFHDFTLLPFENLQISAPLKYKQYLEMVYGKDWNIRKPFWQRTQNKINRKF